MVRSRAILQLASAAGVTEDLLRPDLGSFALVFSLSVLYFISYSRSLFSSHPSPLSLSSLVAFGCKIIAQKGPFIAHAAAMPLGHVHRDWCSMARTVRVFRGSAFHSSLLWVSFPPHPPPPLFPWPRGKIKYEPPRYMTVSQAVQQLLDIEERRKEKGEGSECSERNMHFTCMPLLQHDCVPNSAAAAGL